MDKVFRMAMPARAANLDWPKVLLSVALVTVIFALAFNRTFYDEALVSGYFALALASAAILLFSLCASFMDVALVTAGSALIGAVYLGPLHTYPSLMAWVSFFGLSAFVVLGLRTIWAVRELREKFVYALVPLVLFVLSEYMADTLLDLTERLHPKTLDLYLYSFDCSLGMQISFFAGKVFFHWPWLKLLSILFYVGLPIPIALVYAGHLVKRGKAALPVMITFLIAGPVGVIFYNIFPAAGPVHVFHAAFPLQPLPTAQVANLLLEPVPLHALRNAIPSLHMTWVLLAWWNAKALSGVTRRIVFAFVVFTVLSTLGTGEHYFVDLVVAFPFSLMLQSAVGLTRPERAQRAAFLFGAGTTLGWMALLRFAPKLFWISPAIPWVLIVATIVSTLALRRAFCIPPVPELEASRPQAAMSAAV